MKNHTLLPLNLQFFADGVDGVAGTDTGASTEGTQPTQLDSAGLTALLNTMSQQQSGDNSTAQQNSDQSTQGGDTQTQTGESNQQSNQNQNTQNNQNQNTQQQKDHNAFAAMRVQNQQYADMLEKIAGKLAPDPKATAIDFSKSARMKKPS